MTHARTVVVRGGADGTGRGGALVCLSRGDHVVVIGRGHHDDDGFLAEPRSLNGVDRTVFCTRALPHDIHPGAPGMAMAGGGSARSRRVGS